MIKQEVENEEVDESLQSTPDREEGTKQLVSANSLENTNVVEKEELEEHQCAIDILKAIPTASITPEKRRVLKNQRPMPYLNIKQSCHKSTRFWQPSWYEKFTWTAGCSKNQSMFCYVCLLFGERQNKWCHNGFADLSNFVKEAYKHAASSLHLRNMEAYILLDKKHVEFVSSDAARQQAIKQNQRVANNREVLKRIIQSIIFLAKQEIAFMSLDVITASANKGNYLELLDFLALNESTVREYLQAPSEFKDAFPHLQNDLIEVISKAINESIKREMTQSSFISIQVDETLDVSCLPQVSIILRYCVEDRVEERFVGLYDVPRETSAKDLSEIIRKVLNEFDVMSKVVSQTYDGAILATKSEVQNLLKDLYCPNAVLVHSYAHHLNLVLLHGSKDIPEVKLFVCALTAFRGFFSKSSKRTLLLPTQRWNFQSRAVQTIKIHFKELYHLIFGAIDDEDRKWDCDSINSALALKSHLDDPVFVFLLHLYDACFAKIEPLSKLLHSKSAHLALCDKDIRRAINQLEKIKKTENFVDFCIQKSMELNRNLNFPESIKMNLTQIFYKILDSQISQIKARFDGFQDLEFLELLNERKFKGYKNEFPVNVFKSLCKTYDVFVKDRLQNELINIYADMSKALPPKDLLRYLIGNGLATTVYKETTKLIRLVLTLPIRHPSSDRSPRTLKRIKNFMRKAMADHRLSHLSSLAIEKNLLKDLYADPVFLDQCIDDFAAKKNQKSELLYKAI